MTITKTFSMTPATIQLLEIIAGVEQRQKSPQMRALIIDKARQMAADKEVSNEVKAEIDRLIVEAERNV